MSKITFQFVGSLLISFILIGITILWAWITDQDPDNVVGWIALGGIAWLLGQNL